MSYCTDDTTARIPMQGFIQAKYQTFKAFNTPQLTQISYIRCTRMIQISITTSICSSDALGIDARCNGDRNNSCTRNCGTFNPVRMEKYCVASTCYLDLKRRRIRTNEIESVPTREDLYCVTQKMHRSFVAAR